MAKVFFIALLCKSSQPPFPRNPAWRTAGHKKHESAGHKQRAREIFFSNCVRRSLFITCRTQSFASYLVHVSGHRNTFWTSFSTHLLSVNNISLAKRIEEVLLPRKPILLLRLFGLLLLRLATRQLLSLLLNEPPRSIRLSLFESIPL